MVKELLVLRDLSDEELNSLSTEDIVELNRQYIIQGTPFRATVQGLLSEFDIKFDDLTDFILGFDVGRCNHATRSSNQIYISRNNSVFRDNIVINLDDNVDVPDMTVQIQVTDEFVHEEAYNRDGLLIYQS